MSFVILRFHKGSLKHTSTQPFDRPSASTVYLIIKLSLILTPDSAESLQNGSRWSRSLAQRRR